MQTYHKHLLDNPFIFMSPCAEKFNCSRREDNKSACRIGCRNISLYIQFLDFYGHSGLGGLSVGHVYQSANPIEGDEMEICAYSLRGNRKPMLEEY